MKFMLLSFSSVHLLFSCRETMGGYTEELQTMKGVEKELGR